MLILIHPPFLCAVMAVSLKIYHSLYAGWAGAGRGQVTMTHNDVTSEGSVSINDTVFVLLTLGILSIFEVDIFAIYL